MSCLGAIREWIQAIFSPPKYKLIDTENLLPEYSIIR